ncbi:MAG: polyphosphate polymerase domain-containing protein [Luteolibacter sp.]|uniref:polyphosphate polymerase domain-containing protein n=1 Tax=Luteolibacter sp. TaxID=1962973 RepID=UPI003267568F
MDATQDRREFKFLLPAEEGERFRDFVSGEIPVDRGAEDGYPVISEYYDTEDRHSYWQKIWGAGNRRRVRSRVYGRPDGLIPPAAFIEIKHKLDSDGVKRRAALPIESLRELSVGKIPASLLESGRSKADRNVVEELRDLVVRGGARPVVQVRYDRMAYDSGPEGTIRITFDTGLRCRFDLKPLTPDDPDFHLPVVDHEIAVVEVKTIGAVPTWLRDATGKFRLQSQSMSKYCLSLERYDPAITRTPLPSIF